MIDYVEYLKDRDKVHQPYRDFKSFDRYGQPVVKCPRCDYELILRMEQFCPSCGQRFVKTPNERRRILEEPG